MAKRKDIGDFLVEEVLTEVASDFLSERKEIDDNKALLEGYVSRLAHKATEIRQKAAQLHYLLLEKQIVEAFYEGIGVDPGRLSGIAGKLFDSPPVLEMPFAMTLKKRYSRIVFQAYDHLQQALTQYAYGNEVLEDFKEREVIDAPDVNYRMVMIMADMINEKIKKINEGKSPSSVLQFAKALNPELLEKERVTGAMSPHYESSLDGKLRLAPIDLKRMPVEEFPDLPKGRAVRQQILTYGEKLYVSRTAEIKKRMRHLKEVRYSGNR